MENGVKVAGHSPTPPQYPIESVDSALKLILLFAERSEIRLTDASAHLGVATSTAHRLLAMLAWRGFVRQDPATKAYVPGPSLTTVAFSALRRMDVARIAEPILREVSEALNETSHLGLLEGAGVRFVAVSEPPAAVRVASRLGRTIPAHATSTGKVLLARLSREQLYSLYPEEDLEVVTAHSVRTRSELEEQLAEIVSTGWAVNREESEDGVASVAVAIPTLTGLNVAINASAPVHRLPAKKVKSFALTLQDAAARIGELLG